MEEFFISHTQALVLQGETIKITVDMAGLPGLAVTLRRKINDPHRLPREAISLKAKSGKLIIPPKDAEQLLTDVVALIGQASKR